MSNKDFRENSTERCRDSQTRISNLEVESDRLKTAIPSVPATNNTWSMWPIYLCFGMLLVIVIFTFLATGR